jgi:hypothetical protein
MKTWPQYREDGSLASFEITSSWVTFRPLFKILKSVEGVTDIQRNRFDEHRITFLMHGESIAILEPWGDSSRFLVVPADDESAVSLDSLHEAFERHKGPIASLLARLTGKA